MGLWTPQDVQGPVFPHHALNLDDMGPEERKVTSSLKVTHAIIPR